MIVLILICLSFFVRLRFGYIYGKILNFFFIRILQVFKVLILFGKRYFVFFLILIFIQLEFVSFFFIIVIFIVFLWFCVFEVFIMIIVFLGIYFNMFLVCLVFGLICLIVIVKIFIFVLQYIFLISEQLGSFFVLIKSFDLRVLFFILNILIVFFLCIVFKFVKFEVFNYC